MRIVTALLLLAGALSGCLNEFEDPIPPHFMRIVGVDLSAPVVSSGSVQLRVAVNIDNTGGQSPPVRLEAKAYDVATQLLVTRNATAVDPLQKDETRSVALGLRVPRESSYRIVVDLYEDQRVVQTASVHLNNVDALERNLFETGLRIAEMDFLVRNASAGRAGIEASVYVTNEGDATSKPLRMHVKAREVSTGLLADDEWTDVGAIRPEETRTTPARLDVPGGYNYQVEAVLWDGDFIVGRGQDNVQLLPTFAKPTDQELVVSTPEIENFLRPSDPYGAGTQEARTPGPALGLVLAAVLLLAFAIRARRRSP